jgi:tRNA-specific 2-thiouridylase
LAVADKPDSHDICFIADGDTRGFLARRIGDRPGDVVDADSGAVLGQHGGAFGFTVGQRRGLRLQRPAADGSPRYVLEIRPADNTVVVGGRARLAAEVVHATRPVWTAGAAPATEFDCEVQLRAHGMTSPATVTLDGSDITARLHRPQTGVAAGQALAMYAGDVVLGSATITATERPASQPA